MANNPHTFRTIQQSQAAKETTANALILACSPALAFGLDIEACVGLHVEIFEGIALVDGEPDHIAGQEFDLTDDVTNYLRRNSDGSFAVTTSDDSPAPPTGWPWNLASGATALFDFVAADGAVASWNDYRFGGGVSASMIIAALESLYDGTNITLTMSDGKSLQIGPFE